VPACSSAEVIEDCGDDRLLALSQLDHIKQHHRLHLLTTAQACCNEYTLWARSECGNILAVMPYSVSELALGCKQSFGGCYWIVGIVAVLPLFGPWLL